LSAPAALPTRYRIVPLDPQAHLYEVSVSVDDPHSDGQRFLLPTWIPGSYLIREFSRHFVSVRGETAAGPVSITKVAKNIWQASPCTGPLTVVARKGIALDGNQPVLLEGYGGYGISMAPWFSPLLRIWLDWGGVYAMANVRGGGEFGEAWHLAGNLTRKQNVFDDFAACAQFLIDQKYTRPERLAIIGGSNGGLLMGAMITQHPAMFRAVVSQVGMYDALRWETQPNGAFNVTEFGTVKDPDQFRALHAYSPYLAVRDGTAYPAVLMTSGDNDGRVAPYESRKMTARLQAAAGPDARPVLLRTEATAGHGIGTALATRIAEDTDVYAFLVNELAMKPVAAPTAARRR